ncbi:MAG TPA: hypothetical protein VHN14_28540 [Kofleriaceae bacterium]|jgi:hypothetical protein|nr:hypothetical protein [Kofleriaceae bacterium]
MAIDNDSLTEVLQLAQTCEDVARATLTVAQNQLRTKLIAQDAFDQVFQDYGVAMQKARDMYYQASHGLVQQILSSTDLKVLVIQTAELKAALVNLKEAEHVLSISVGVVTLIASVATAVITPSSDTLKGAVSAATTLKQTITG